MSSLRWGIIGTGNIATLFAKALKVAKKGKLVGVGSRSLETAKAFGQQFDTKHCFGSYQELLNSPDIDIVYISTPHPQHFELASAAVKANKHVLIEKPMGMNEAQVQAIFELAKERGLFVMEAYMYRCHPQTLKVVELVRSGRLGQVKHVMARFSFDGRPLGPQSRLWRNELGGGAILDIGGYPMSFARLIAGVVNGSDTEGANPTEVKATGYIQQNTLVDEWANASLAFEGGMTAQLFTGIFCDGDSSVEILGDQGSLKVQNLWRPDLKQLGPVEIELRVYGKEKEIIPIKLEETDIYAIEADAVADAVFQGKLECKYMTWKDSIGQVRAVDNWRKEIGLVYKEDQ
ncbi:hypothetical protein G6F37_005310 [Rhizopus arrhizus]|nr:hypothetical protein G6F38_010600 [Rhizopus arrhizus]KAG1158980.1 hypothetical protein G6F37_005310 [Rhizopus arrhizus]